jgi:hypothetical protein
MEFLVWTALIQQSRGLLHVFLPLLDNGLDGVVHRLTDGAYVPLQVKSRDRLDRGKVQIVVPGHSLVDDGALLIAGLLTDDGLGETLLVVEEGTFKQLAAHEVVDGIDVYEAEFSLHPTEATRWHAYLVARERLAERIMGGQVPGTDHEATALDEVRSPDDRARDRLGFLGESEVIRRLAENPQLDLFRPFPDLELVEVLARDHVSLDFIGLQIKTATPEPTGKVHFRIRKATLRSTSSTAMVGLAWLPDRARFANECLLIPATDLAQVAVDSGDSLDVWFRPESPERTRLDPYRKQIPDLAQLIAGNAATRAS